MSRSSATPLLLLLLPVACAGPRWSLRDPGPLAPEKRALLAKAEKPYRKGEPIDELRAEIAADPVAAWWWARMAVRDVMSAREVRAEGAEQGSVSGQRADEALEKRIREARGGPDDGESLLLATAGKRDPVEERGLAELEKLGVAAVPCLVYDVACHTDGFTRQNGAELLARIGDPALPLVRQELLESKDPMRRRTAARYFELRMPGELAEGELLRLAADADYGVRGAACDGLARGGAPSRRELLRLLVDDADPFVRRCAAVALGMHKGAEPARALCDYLARSQKDGDEKGCEAAQRALQLHSRTRSVRSLDAWRGYASAVGATVEPTKGR